VGRRVLDGRAGGAAEMVVVRATQWSRRPKDRDYPTGTPPAGGRGARQGVSWSSVFCEPRLAGERDIQQARILPGELPESVEDSRGLSDTKGGWQVSARTCFGFVCKRTEHSGVRRGLLRPVRHRRRL